MSKYPESGYENEMFPEGIDDIAAARADLEDGSSQSAQTTEQQSEIAGDTTAASTADEIMEGDLCAMADNPNFSSEGEI